MHETFFQSNLLSKMKKWGFKIITLSVCVCNVFYILSSRPIFISMRVMQNGCATNVVLLNIYAVQQDTQSVLMSEFIHHVR